MAKYVSGRQKNLKVGISSYSENLTSLEVIGNVGIATTNATSRLYVVGDGYFTGVVTATAFYGTFSGNVATATYATSAGIATYATNAGIATYADNAGIATYATNAGIATYATNAGIATYATNAGIATYATNAGYSTSSGISTDAIKLQTPRTFEITGNIVGAAVTFDGTGNVSIAATIQPNSVGLGTDTTGDYVQSITGTSNQISVSVTSGEGSAPILSIPNQFTIPQDATVLRDLQVNRNLNVNGNITIGGTSATLFSQTLSIFDPDIVLGYRTDAFGNDVSNDSTANHGGVALASTEGTPLVDLFISGIEINPSTYKKIMWFKTGEFAGLGTDAWLFNYAVGIGSTQFPTGTRLAAGSVQFTENDLAVVRNINSTGIITATTGNLTTVNITTGNIVTGIVTSISGTNLNYSGIGTIATLNSTGANLTTANITTGNIVTGVVTTISGTNLNYSGIGTIATLTSTNATLTNINSSGISTFTNGPVLIGSGTSTGTASQRLQVDGGAYFSGIGASVGIGTTNPQFKLDVNGDINFNGTFYQNGSQFVASRWDSGTGDNIYRLNGNVGVGTTNPTVPLSVIGNANFTGVVTASSFSGNASSATYADNAGVSTYATSSGIATYATNAGIATNLKGGVIGNIPYQSTADTTAFLTNGASGTILQSNGVGNVPTWVSAAPSGAITGITIRDEGDLVGVEGSVTQLDFVGSNISVASTSGIATITVSNNLVGTALSISGISTFNNTLNVVPTATSIAGLFSGTTSSDMVRITQLGTGNALVVEDETNPDSSPFVVAADGKVGIGTTNPTSKLYVVGDGYFTGILTANRIISSVYGEFVGGSISGTNIVGTALSITGISTFSNGPVFIGAATSTGTASQPLQVTGGAYVSENIGIGTTNPTSKLSVVGDGNFTGVVTATSFSGSGTNLTGIVTSIVAGTNITVSGFTGQVTINAAGGLDILEVMLFA